MKEYVASVIHTLNETIDDPDSNLIQIASSKVTVLQLLNWDFAF